MAWLTAAQPARAEPPPLTQDLAAAARLARERGVPVFVAFTLRHCPYCVRARREYWTPMNESAEWRARTLMVEVMLDGEPALRDFDGAATTVREFGKRFGIRSVPTVIVFDAEGKAAAAPVVGLAAADFYGAYLEQAVEQGLAKMRASR
jgi:thioredoxin-related protein